MDGYIPEVVHTPGEVLCDSCVNKEDCEDQPQTSENGMCGSYETHASATDNLTAE